MTHETFLYGKSSILLGFLMWFYEKILFWENSMGGRSEFEGILKSVKCFNYNPSLWYLIWLNFDDIIFTNFKNWFLDLFHPPFFNDTCSIKYRPFLHKFCGKSLNVKFVPNKRYICFNYTFHTWFVTTWIQLAEWKIVIWHRKLHR